MKVKDLIEILQTKEQDAECFIQMYEPMELLEIKTKMVRTKSPSTVVFDTWS